MAICQSDVVRKKKQIKESGDQDLIPRFTSLTSWEVLYKFLKEAVGKVTVQHVFNLI